MAFTIVLLWGIGCFIFLVVLTLGLISEVYPGKLIFVTCILAFAVLGVIKYLLWQAKGKETLTFTDSQIVIEKSGPLFKKKLELNYFEVDEFLFDEDKETFWWIKFYGIGGGKIIVRYLGRKKRFGQDLTTIQAKKLIEEIKLEFEKRKSTHNVV